MAKLTLTQAQDMIAAGLTLARQHSLGPLTLVVLNEGGQVKATASQDGSGTLRYDIALGKASAALGMGFGTRQFYSLVQNGVLPEMFATTINGAAQGNFIPMPGGVLIKDKQGVIGALGVSGASSDDDEKIAIGAITTQGFSASP